MDKPTILVVGTLDTKRDETLFLRSQILSHGSCSVKILDVGRTLRRAEDLQIPADELVPRMLRIADPPADLPRGEMINATIERCIPIVVHLLESSSIQGIVAAGGSSGSSLATALMRKCPVGFPKLMVSTMASGDIKHYIEETDITMMYSVVDIAGMNSVLGRILSNAAGAIVGMTTAYAKSLKTEKKGSRTEGSGAGKRIGITMFGVTTPCVDNIRRILSSPPHDIAKHEIYIFHATGAGGLAMERLVDEGQLDAIIDLTTTEVCDHLSGGVLSAGPHRLEAGARKGIPMVVSVGACDMVNFGPKDTVPNKYWDRTLFEHNPAVTLMRTTENECRDIGKFIAEKLKTYSTQPEMIKVLLPTGGVSMIDKPGQPFHDEKADEALFSVLEDGLKPTKIEVKRLPNNVNDDAFSEAMVEALMGLIQGHKLSASRQLDKWVQMCQMQSSLPPDDPSKVYCCNLKRHTEVAQERRTKDVGQSTIRPCVPPLSNKSVLSVTSPSTFSHTNATSSNGRHDINNLSSPRPPQNPFSYEFPEWSLDDYNFDAECQLDPYFGLAGLSPNLISSESPSTQPPSTKPYQFALPQIPEPNDEIGCDFADLWPINEPLCTEYSFVDELAPTCGPGNGHRAGFSPGSSFKISAESSTQAQVPSIPSLTYEDEHRMLKRTPNSYQHAQHPTHSNVFMSPNCDPQSQPAANIYDGHLPAPGDQSDDKKLPSPHLPNPPSPPRASPRPIFDVLTSDPIQPNSPDARTADSEAKKLRRQRNSAAARKYRQRRLDRIDELEQALKESQTERDELKVQVARWRGKAEALRALMAPNSATGDEKNYARSFA